MAYLASCEGGAMMRWADCVALLFWNTQPQTRRMRSRGARHVYVFARPGPLALASNLEQTGLDYIVFGASWRVCRPTATSAHYMCLRRAGIGVTLNATGVLEHRLGLRGLGLPRSGPQHVAPVWTAEQRRTPIHQKDMDCMDCMVEVGAIARWTGAARR